MDIVWRNITNRVALDELSGWGVVTPAREWRIRPGGFLDWGRPEQIFTDRTGIVLAEDDVWVRDDREVLVSYEDFVDRVKLVGTERETPQGRKILVVGEAIVSPGDRRTYWDDPFARTHLIEDAGIDARDVANDIAAATLEEDQAQVDSVTLGLNDWTVLGEFDVGDWVYPYLPREGLVDPAVSLPWRDGTIVHPRKLRVLSRELVMGPGVWEVTLRRPDGSGFDLSRFVLWGEETAATVVLGRRLPTFIANAQGGGVSRQYRRYRGHPKEG